MKVGSRQWLARQGLRAAHDLRQQLGKSPLTPINSIDAAVELGISVRLMLFPSLEGVFLQGRPPSIVLSTLRPKGRVQFTCAHELGHFVLGHGERFEEVLDTVRSGGHRSTEELLADAFAGFLLMPPVLVRRAFSERGIVNCESALDALRVAQWLGVGYQSLITHMSVGLHALPRVVAQHLLKLRPTDILTTELGYRPSADVILVDRCWVDRPIDLCVGDLILLEFGAIVVDNEKLSAVEPPRSGTTLLSADRPGLERLEAEDRSWSAYVRIQPKHFSGLARFRHLEELGDET